MKSRLKPVFILVTIAVLVSGCAGNTDSNTSVSATSTAQTKAAQTTASSAAVTTTATTTAITESEDYPENVITKNKDGEIQFDFDDALNNIYIAGKKVSFPDTVEDLGEGFGLRMANAVDAGSGYIGESIMYQGDEVGDVILKECTIDNYSVKNKVAFIAFSNRDEFNTISGIYKFRIGDMVSKEDVKKYFGKPTEEKLHSLYYRNPKNKKSYIKFWFGIGSSDDGIFQIEIATDDLWAE
ncbi:MAG: hypothetical protein QM689_04050 [Oscillospiraceae bacterium]